MIISIELLRELYSDKNFSEFSDKRLEWKLKAIESAIRRITHNKFLNRAYKYSGIVKDGKLYLEGQHFLNIDDTVYMTDSHMTDGLFVVKSIDDGVITFDTPLFSTLATVIKVEYPPDIIDGAVELLDWSCNYSMADKQGIASESISRHSVSYVQRNESNMKEGYPVEKLNFLKKYTEWRT